MITDIRKKIDQEIQGVIDKLIGYDPENFEQVDLHYVEICTPFLINPDIRNEDWKTKIGIVFYSELLSYSDTYIKRETASEHESSNNVYGVTVPWICVRFELEGEANNISRELCKWIVNIFKGIGYYPFMDEDASFMHFSKDERRGYTKYKMYINPDYPEGYWENHTL